MGRGEEWEGVLERRERERGKIGIGTEGEGGLKKTEREWYLGK